MDIVLDFDGTCVTHEFPEIGKEIGAAEVLKEFTDNGFKIFLNTMRCNVTDEVVMENLWSNSTERRNYLDEAVEWFKKHNIPLAGINEKNPAQLGWTTSPKIYGDVIIDDAAVGAFLKFDRSLSQRPFIDWQKVRTYLKSYIV